MGRLNVGRHPRKSHEPVGSRPFRLAQAVRHLDGEVPGAEKQQARIPVAVGAIKREAKTKPRAVMRKGALGTRRGDDDMVQPPGPGRRRDRRGKGRRLRFHKKGFHPAAVLVGRPETPPAPLPPAVNIARRSGLDGTGMQTPALKRPPEPVNVADTEHQRGKARAGALNPFPKPPRPGPGAVGKEELHINIREPENDPPDPVLAPLTDGGGRSQERGVGRLAGHARGRKDDKVVETLNHDCIPVPAAGRAGPLADLMRKTGSEKR